jgi:hypothetical protein
MAKPAIAWAVLCKDGSVHEGDENSCLFLADDQAKDEAEALDIDKECGPHKVVTLVRR